MIAPENARFPFEVRQLLYCKLLILLGVVHGLDSRRHCFASFDDGVTMAVSTVRGGSSLEYVQDDAVRAKHRNQWFPPRFQGRIRGE